MGPCGTAWGLLVHACGGIRYIHHGFSLFLISHVALAAPIVALGAPSVALGTISAALGAPSVALGAHSVARVADPLNFIDFQ